MSWLDTYIHLEFLPCSSVKIVQACEGACEFNKSINISYKKTEYVVVVSQNEYKRIYIISKRNEGNAEELYQIFAGIEKYVMLVEGRFFEIKNLDFFFVITRWPTRIKMLMRQQVTKS